ncbi:RNase H domain-containing protein [Trichonephila clavipes]|nr:RNase H domain-containing protein [Trichonephila clavipes]
MGFLSTPVPHHQTNLLQLERVQLSAACLITSLRNSCPNEVVLYEANLPPLNLVINSNLVKYYNKLKSYETQNRTSEYLCKWKNNQRLKKNSPFSMADKMKIIFQSVEHTSQRPCVNQVEGLPGVRFHTELLSHTNKNSDGPEYLRQLALEVINGIPNDVILIYTGGSKGNKDESNRTGSGGFIEKLSIRLSRRSPENCSVLKSELISIDEGL